MQITLTNLGAVTPDEAEETLQTVTDFLKGLNLEKLITLLLLLAGCLVVMKLVLRLTDRAFLRLELERSLPEDEEEIFSYLSSGICKGVGPATARRIVERFGAETLDVLEREPELLRTLQKCFVKQ